MKRSELPKGYVEPQKLRKEFKENRITGDNKSLFPIEHFCHFSNMTNMTNITGDNKSGFPIEHCHFQRLTCESTVGEMSFIWSLNITMSFTSTTRSSYCEFRNFSCAYNHPQEIPNKFQCRDSQRLRTWRSTQTWSASGWRTTPSRPSRGSTTSVFSNASSSTTTESSR